MRSGGVERARSLLRADAALCAVSGLALVAAAVPLAELLERERVTAVRIVGALLLVVAVDFALLSRVREQRLAPALTAVGVLNVAWVAGTAALVIAGVFEPLGAILAVLSGVLVAAFAWHELKAAKDVEGVLRRAR